MPDPLVSVVMAVKNGERYLPSAIDSVRAQSYLPLEIIVVDGHSADRTADIAKVLHGVRYFDQPDDGLANARNAAIEYATGEFIAFLDADDVWAPDKLRTQLAFLQAHPDVLGTVTWLRFVLEPDFVSRHAYALQEFYKRDVIGYTPSALLARRDLFSRVGAFDPAYSVACDADWFARLSGSGLSVAILPQVLLYKRIHGSNLSLNTSQARQEILRMLRSSLLRKRVGTGQSG